MINAPAPNTISNIDNTNLSALRGYAKPPFPSNDVHVQNDEENTSVCSSVLTTDEDHVVNVKTTTVATSTSTATATPNKPRKKKSKFTITKATPRTTPTSSSDAVSISFLSPTVQEETTKAKPTQVIQKALTGLRPGGVFFVLDYRDDSTDNCASNAKKPTTTAYKNPNPSPAAAGDAQSPQSCSLAMKEIPPDLVEQWNLTMVPTNLESYYNTKLKQPAAKPAPTRVSLPASKRIVRWMGIKPRNQQITPKS